MASISNYSTQILDISKSSNSYEVHVNNIFTYTITLKNNSSTIASNVFFQDVLCKYCTFIFGSVYINNQHFINYDPNAGFFLDDIHCNEICVVRFNAKTTSIPPSNFIINNAYATFTYTIENMTYEANTIASNTTSIEVLYSNILENRFNNCSYPVPGDIVTYTLQVTNMGNRPSDNIFILESEILGTNFVEGSVKINNESYPLLNPFIGFNVGSIIPQEILGITYDVLILKIITPESVINQALVPYEYKITPSGPIIYCKQDSNKVLTRSNFVNIVMTKSVDKDYEMVDDTLFYSVSISNNGTIEAYNVLFIDTLQSHICFIPGTVYINGFNYPNYNPNNGFSLDSIYAGNTIFVTFQAKVVSIPPVNIVCNVALLTYDYKPNPTGSYITTTTESNPVSTFINDITLAIEKSVDKTNASIGNTLVYSITLNNKNSLEIYNVTFKDIIDSNVLFINNSVLINNIPYDDFNPNTGFNLGTLLPKSYVKIVFSVKVISSPPEFVVKNTSTCTYTYRQVPNGPLIRNTVISNTVSTNIIIGNITVVKTSNKDTVAIGDTIVYTTCVTNTGNIHISHTNFYDSIPLGTTFVPRSVFIDDINYEAYNPNNAFTIGALEISQKIIVKFSVIATSIPVNTVITNSSFVTFGYYPEINTPSLSNTVESNTIITKIIFANISITKTADKTTADLYDTITYNFQITNTGTTLLQNLIFKDIIQNETTFVEDSLYINGTYYPCYYPSVGIKLPNLNIGESYNLSFKVQITSLPETKTILNQGKINYKYTLNSPITLSSAEKVSNQTSITIGSTILSSTKTVSLPIASLNSQLTFITTLKNNSNYVALNPFFIDILDSNLNFIYNSVTVNGTRILDANPNIGFTLPNILPDEISTIKFDTIINATPNDLVISNFSTTKYQYKLSSVYLPTTETVVSNITSTFVDLLASKYVDKQYATVGDTLTYYFSIKNYSAFIITNVFFRDVIPYGLSFLENSVYINNVNIPKINPYDGFSLGTLIPGAIFTVSFKATIILLPIQSQIENIGSIVFNYKPTDSSLTMVSEINTNPAITQIHQCILSIKKSVDKPYSFIDDILTYSINIENLGNIDALNVFFYDTLESYVNFLSGSVKINGISNPTLDPIQGFDLGVIETLSSLTVSFSVVVASVPNSYIGTNFASIIYSYKINPLGYNFTKSSFSNTVSTIINDGSLDVIKKVFTSCSLDVNTLLYKITIVNTGSVSNYNIFLKDLIPIGTTFVNGSVTIDTTPYTNCNPGTGFTLPPLMAGCCCIVTFTVTIISRNEPLEISNLSTINYTYKLPPNNIDITKTIDSNTVLTDIDICKLVIDKAVNSAVAKVGDILTYTSRINNLGNILATTLWFYDILHPSLSFVPESVTINATIFKEFNPNEGFSLGSLSINNSIIVEFQCIIISLPSTLKVDNESYVKYHYLLPTTNSNITSTAISNSVTSEIITGELSCNKSVDKSSATLKDILTFTMTIKNTGNILTNHVVVEDIIDSNLLFNTGSVFINNINIPTADPSYGIDIDNINIGEVVVVQFSTTIISVPANNLITNQGIISYEYYITSIEPPITKTTKTNLTVTKINFALISVVKSVDSDFATIGQTLTYTVTVTNTGNISSDNVSFIDPTPNNSIFILGSVFINSINHPEYYPSIGFNIGSLQPLESTIINYQVKVIN